MEIGRLTKLRVNEVLRLEERDFTPWLEQEDNIELLSEAVGIPLVVRTREASINGFEADLVCLDAEDPSHLVIIENQYGGSDHRHLGQLLSYAATGAKSFIWITEAFKEGHRAALDWLNDNTNETVGFYGVEIEFWRIGESATAPRFNVVVRPNAEVRRLRKAGSAAIDGFSPLWMEVLRGLEERGATDGLKPGKLERRPNQWIDVPGEKRFWFTLYNEKGNLGIFARFKQERGIRLYQHLSSSRDRIEVALGRPILFEERPDKATIDLKNIVSWSEPANWPLIAPPLSEAAALFIRTILDSVREADRLEGTTEMKKIRR